jgi:short-subunit dehydrogenase
MEVLNSKQSVGNNNGSDISFLGVNIPSLVVTGQQLLRTLLALSLSLPKLLIGFYLSSVKNLYATLTYHIRYMLKESPSIQGDKYIILGANSTFGRAFSSQVVKMNGTAICVDSDEVAGQTYVKALNDSLGTKDAQNVRAFFYQCDFHEEAEVVQVLNEINKQHQDLSVVINASKYDSLIATYFAVFNHVLNVMQKNGKGKMVFIRTLDKGPRDAIMAMYSQIKAQIAVAGTQNVSTVIAHVYPNITKDETKSSGVFGYLQPEDAARSIIEGVALNRNVIYLPGFMVYLAFFLKFLPSSLANGIDGVLFEDNKKAALRPLAA